MIKEAMDLIEDIGAHSPQPEKVISEISSNNNNVLISDYETWTNSITINSFLTAYPNTEIIIVAKKPTYKDAGHALAKGAIEYIDINNLDALALIVNNLISHIRSEKEIKKTLMKNYSLVSNNQEYQKMLYFCEKAATTNANVLLIGESGTGKEVAAKYIHLCSQRNTKPFVAVNCSSFSDTLLESELFGYDQGAFTGANKSRIGRFEIANKGTLFLDEIDSLPILLQAKILRAIETKMIKRIGSVKEKHIDFRLITATNADLNELVKEKKFRQDLYFRLNVVPVKIPALRERPYDIIPLAVYFLKYYCSEYNKNKQFSKKVFDSLIAYDWPGNVRELKNFVERMVVMSLTSVIELTDVPKGILEDFSIKENDTAFISEDMDYETGKNDTNYLFDIENNSYKELMAIYEEELIKHALFKYKSTYKAAKILGINQSTVFRKKKKYEKQ